MATRTQKLLDAVTATGAGSARYPRSPRRTFHANGTTSSGAGAATIKIQGSNDDGTTWVDLATITLTLSTTVSGDGFASDAAWEKVRANVTALSGTGAAVTCWMGD